MIFAYVFPRNVFHQNWKIITSVSQRIINTVNHHPDGYLVIIRCYLWILLMLNRWLQWLTHTLVSVLKASRSLKSVLTCCTFQCFWPYSIFTWCFTIRVLKDQSSCDDQRSGRHEMLSNKLNFCCQVQFHVSKVLRFFLLESLMMCRSHYTWCRVDGTDL